MNLRRRFFYGGLAAVVLTGSGCSQAIEELIEEGLSPSEVLGVTALIAEESGDTTLQKTIPYLILLERSRRQRENAEAAKPETNIYIQPEQRAQPQVTPTPVQPQARAQNRIDGPPMIGESYTRFMQNFRIFTHTGLVDTDGDREEDTILGYNLGRYSSGDGMKITLVSVDGSEHKYQIKVYEQDTGNYVIRSRTDSSWESWSLDALFLSPGRYTAIGFVDGVDVGKINFELTPD
jgi:hypothetical protein